MIELVSPDQTSELRRRVVNLPGGEQLEVFVRDGVEYIRAVTREQAEIAVSFRKLGNLSPLYLRRRDSSPAANALCSLHKTYRAVRKPRTSCAQCWAAYERKAP